MRSEQPFKLLLMFLLIAGFSVGCAQGGDAPDSQPAGVDDDEVLIEDDELLLPQYITQTDDSALFVLVIRRSGYFDDGTRTANIQIEGQVPITSLSSKDWTFSSKGYGMLEQTGTAGPTALEGVQEVIYEVKGRFLGCDIYFDEVMETWGEGELCVTVPIAGKACEPITEGESDYFLLETEIMIFEAFSGEGDHWWSVHEWDYGGIHWTDNITVTDFGPALELKVFEYMGCEFIK
jgi:hypothetical protein